MKIRIVLLTMLASVGFFNPFGILSDTLQKLMFYLCICGGLVYALFDGHSLRDIKYPRAAYFLLLAGILFSGFMATAFQMQSLKISMMTLLPFIFAYGFFYILMKLDIPKKKIMNMFLFLCLASSLVYFCNLATMPNNMFGEPILGEDVTRGIIRIPVIFIEMFPIVVFYSINQWFIEKKKKWLFIAGYAFLLIVLSVVRQVILFTALLGFLFLLRSVSWKLKIFASICIVGIVVFVLPMIPMYNTMLELSEQQKEENEDEENIRIQAWRYYTYEHQTNGLTPIFGNGVPSLGNSRWGIEFDAETQDNGCFVGDVGWAGFFWQFGLIATLSLLYLMIRGLMVKKPFSDKYINYALIFLLLSGIASAPNIYYFQILTLTTVLYLAYKDEETDALPQEMNLDETCNKSWVRHLPQLR